MGGVGSYKNGSFGFRSIIDFPTIKMVHVISEFMNMRINITLNLCNPILVILCKDYI